MDRGTADSQDVLNQRYVRRRTEANDRNDRKQQRASYEFQQFQDVSTGKLQNMAFLCSLKDLLCFNCLFYSPFYSFFLLGFWASMWLGGILGYLRGIPWWSRAPPGRWNWADVAPGHRGAISAVSYGWELQTAGAGGSGQRGAVGIPSGKSIMASWGDFTFFFEKKQ